VLASIPSLLLLAGGAFAAPAMVVGTTGALPVVTGADVVWAQRGVRASLAVQLRLEASDGPVAIVVASPSPVADVDARVLPSAWFERLDRATAPRRVELVCAAPAVAGLAAPAGASPGAMGAARSAAITDALEADGFVVPAAARAVLLRQAVLGAQFAVVHVDPAAQRQDGDGWVLPPVQVRYESRDAVLPLALGAANQRGSQELILHVLADAPKAVGNRPGAVASVHGHRLNDEGGAARYDAWFDREQVAQPGMVAIEHVVVSPRDGVGLDAAALDALGWGWIGDGEAAGAPPAHTRLHLRLPEGDPRAALVLVDAPPPAADALGPNLLLRGVAREAGEPCSASVAEVLVERATGAARRPDRRWSLGCAVSPSASAGVWMGLAAFGLRFARRSR
jgi:hypothetical protein